MLQTSTGFVGLDVGLIKARELQFHSTDFEANEAFTVDRPRVFFGGILSAGDVDFYGQTYLTHSNRWPNEDSPFVPLISLPGELGIDAFSHTTDRCAGYGAAMLRPVESQGMWRSTHDVVAGSSGGTVLAPSTPAEGSPAMTSLRAFGVLKGAVQSSGSPYEWGDPVPSDLFGNSFALFTPLTNTMRSNIDRDPSPSGNPSTPVPALTGRPLRCIQTQVDENGKRQCVEWVLNPSSSDPSALPGPGGYVSGDEALEPGQFARMVTCTYPGTPGAMIGLHGSVALAGQLASHSVKDIVQNGGAIGSFMMICTPYSRSSYTDNWRFVVLRGGQVDRGLDNLGGQPISGGYLDHYISMVYEQRGQDGTVVVRPPSMKVCPPNHLLQAFTLVRRNNRYVGLKELECYHPATSSLKIVSLSNEIGGYTMRGESFSLRQLIGDVQASCVFGQCTRIACAANEVMRGLEMAHDAIGRLLYTDALCAPAP